MIYKFNDDLWMATKMSMSDHHDAGTEDEFVGVLSLCNGVTTIIVREDDPRLTHADDYELVHYSATMRFGLGQNPDPDFEEQFINAYAEQAAMITKHNCVPIPSVTTMAVENLDPTMTLKSAVGVWHSAVSDYSFDSKSEQPVVSFHMVGTLFRNIIDPAHELDESNVDSMLIAKQLHVNTEVYGIEAFDDTPYRVFVAGIARADKVRNIDIDLDDEGSDAHFDEMEADEHD